MHMVEFYIFIEVAVCRCPIYFNVVIITEPVC